MKYRLIFAFVIALLFVFMIEIANPNSLSAQSRLSWSPAHRIPGIADDSLAPYLVADQNKTVHAFNSQWIDSDLAIFYSQWTLARGWTYPTDILLSPNKDQAIILSAFLDPKGMMHIIFFGGVAEGAEIYYSRALAANANDARAWTPPKLVGDFAGKLSSGALAGDAQGNLFIVYSGNRDGNGLYEIHSTDGGDTWSKPKSVFLTNNNLWVYDIQTTLDSQGQLHTVWDVTNKAGIAETLYYARLGKDHQQWSFPVVMGTLKECQYKTNMASMISYKGTLFLMYNCGAPPQRWLRRSSDGGITWSNAVNSFTSLVGENGIPVFLIDSDNRLHVILANRIGSPEIHGLWHSEWDGQRWNEPEAIVSGPRSREFDPSLPQAIISQGNVLLATWRQDPGPEMQTNGVWYSYATLKTSELTPIALPTMAATPTVLAFAPAKTAIPSPTLLPRVAFTPSSDNPSVPASDIDPNVGLLIAMVPVIVLLLAIVVVRNLRGAA